MVTKQEYFVVLKKGMWEVPDLGGKVIYTAFGPPKESEELFRLGKPYVGLKQGAEKLFKKDKIETIIQLINQAPRKEDVEILMLANTSKKVQEAGEVKLRTFSKLLLE